MVNFQQIADKKLDEIERPPLLPIGTYVFVVEKLPEFGNVGNGRFDTVDFQMKVVSPADDVDPDDVEAYGDVTNARIRHRFMFNLEDDNARARSEYNLKRFLLEHLQVDGADTLSEAMNAAVGHRCLGEIKWRPDQNDPEVQYVELKRTAPEM